MEGLGTHHSTTHEQRIVGHSLVAGRFVLLDRRCPLAPQVHRQEKVCESGAMAFQSKVALMEGFIRTVEPGVRTRTHVVLDCWSCATCLWRAARDRAFLITTSLKSNRWLHIPDDTSVQGWRGPKLSGSPAGLSGQDCVQTIWPRDGKAVSAHIVTTRVRHSPAQARYRASRLLEAAPSALLVHIRAHRDSTVLFVDGKAERGLDHSRLMSALAFVRFWTLALLVSVTLRGRTAPLARDLTTPGDHWRSSTRAPSSPSLELA